MSASIPAATYRLQFHHGFRFIAAQALIPYLHALGISLYASPFFKARRQSLHGYSVTNPWRSTRNWAPGCLSPPSSGP